MEKIGAACQIIELHIFNLLKLNWLNVYILVFSKYKKV